MNLATELAQKLKEYQLQNAKLQAWRFDLHESKGLEVGLKNNLLGGPYSAPSYKNSIAGELYLIWEGQYFTAAKIDAQVMEGFSQYMELWQKTAYHDPDGVGLYQPTPIPEVPLTDQQVLQVIDHDFEPCFQILARGLAELTADGLEKVDGQVRCYQDQRYLMNSDGLELVNLQTPMSFYFEVNNRYAQSYTEKKWPEEAELARVINETGRIGRLLSQEIPDHLSGSVDLLLPPNIFESFLSYFLIGNLSGSLVVNGQSRYSLDDFAQTKQVLREDLSLELNNLLPYRSFSYQCTAEGVPGGKVSLINQGKLMTPILNLKYAQKTGLKPTPLSNGGFFLRSTSTLPSWEELISQTKRGLIVYSILGLHTQDASSGEFSLTADQCLLVENGEIRGQIKAVINGDFLGSLQKSESKLGFVPNEDNPGYLMTAFAG